VRSQLTLRSPNDGTGWEDSWDFTGGDESVLRDCLGRIHAYLTPAPTERWDPKQHRRVIEADDRWLAAMLLFADEMSPARLLGGATVIQAEAAWTVNGARQLAQLLPDELGDLRSGIEERFGAISG